MDFLNLFSVINDTALETINISITASWIVLIVLLLRMLMMRMPSWCRLLLWSFVGIRLAVPISVESILSLIPSKEIFTPQMVYSNKFSVDSGIDVIDSTVNSHMASHYYEGVTVPSGLKINILGVFSALWVIGIIILLLYFVFSSLKFKFELRTATKVFDNVYKSELVDSPFVFGFLKLRIYLPYNVDEKDSEYILMHERMHIKRGDHLLKALTFILLSFYWFNPILWVAFKYFCRDIEAACDEKAIKPLSKDERKEYSKTLLRFGVQNEYFYAGPVLFGEHDIKSRIRRVMSYKKPSFTVIIIAAVICLVTAVCLLTDPLSDTKKTVDVSETLDSAISSAILENEKGKYFGDGYPCEAHVVLATTEDGPIHDGEIEYTTVEVFIIAKYAQYSIDNGTLIEESGMVSPLALVFESDGNENYALLEYWEPGMGSDYHKSLQERFPKGVDFSTDNFYEHLRSVCEEKARTHVGLSLTGYDKVYTLSVESTTLSGVFLPKLSINTNDGTFTFVYDLLSSYLPAGTFEIQNGKLIADTLDGMYRYVFNVVNDNELRFNEKESDKIKVTNEDLSYEIAHGSSFLIGNPQRTDSGEFTTTAIIAGEHTVGKADPIPPYAEEFSDYTLTLSVSGDEGIRQLTDENFRQTCGYSVYTYSLHNVYISVGDNKLPLNDGIQKGIVGIDGLIAKAKRDAEKGRIKSRLYKDGGSVLYEYEDYSILKMNKITNSGESVIKDVFIGPAGLSINDLSDFYTEFQ